MLQYRTDVILHFSPALVFVFVVAFIGCATDTPTTDASHSPSLAQQDATRRSPQINETEQAAFSVSVANILNQPLPARVRLEPVGTGRPGAFEVPAGSASFTHAIGDYRAFVYAYEDEVPILVGVESVRIQSGAAAQVAVSVLEGSSGNRPLRAFDQDFDLALDRVEVNYGTDPADARSVPGLDVHDWSSPVLSEQGAWYRGELHAYSHYGPGSESVARLIRRAESARLDFLAITDPNTLSAAFDPEFVSDRLVLIPAMEWGNPDYGMALLYAPGIAPPVPRTRPEAQAEVIRVQSQGGIFAVAHPLWPQQPWEWGLQYFNAVEVWCGGWREMQPASLAQLDQQWQARNDRGELVYAIAEAAATEGISANGQSALYYDLEVNRGMKSCVIGGSRSMGPGDPLGRPVTHVYAREKSLKGILEGLRRGRTFVSKGMEGPFVEFQADVLVDGTIDVGIGGIIPINKKSRLIIGVEGAKGARLEVLLNGLPIRSRPIESDKLFYSFIETPGVFGVYRVRVVATPDEEGYGFADMLAMTSPIYAQGYIVDPGKGETGGWIEIENAYQDVEEFRPEDLDPTQVRTLEPRQAAPRS